MDDRRQERRERTQRVIGLRLRRLVARGLPVAEPHRLAEVRRTCVRRCFYCSYFGAKRTARRVERHTLLDEDDRLMLSAREINRFARPRVRRRLGHV